MARRSLSIRARTLLIVFITVVAITAVTAIMQYQAFQRDMTTSNQTLFSRIEETFNTTLQNELDFLSLTVRSILENYDDDLSAFRRTVVEANRTQQPVLGLEVGRGGPGTSDGPRSIRRYVAASCIPLS